MASAIRHLKVKQSQELSVVSDSLCCSFMSSQSIDFSTQPVWFLLFFLFSLLLSPFLTFFFYFFSFLFVFFFWEMTYLYTTFLNLSTLHCRTAQIPAKSICTVPQDGGTADDSFWQNFIYLLTEVAWKAWNSSLLKEDLKWLMVRIWPHVWGRCPHDCEQPVQQGSKAAARVRRTLKRPLKCCVLPSA